VLNFFYNLFVPRTSEDLPAKKKGTSEDNNLPYCSFPAG
jgi:hypothetical protein